MSMPDFDTDGIAPPREILEDLAALPDHARRDVRPAPGAHTVDGTTTIIGNDGMRELVEQLCSLVAGGSDGPRLRVIAEGSSTGMPALLTGRTLLAPLSRHPWPEDLAAFRAVHGADPLMIRIGSSGHGPRETGKTPPAVYVHATNPLAGITMEEVRRIVARDHPSGAIRRWRQLGLDEGPWSTRAIHLYGLPATGGFAGNFAARELDGAQHAEHYEELADRRELAHAVANDPFGIGISGWSPAWRFSRDLRPLPLAASERSEAVLPTFREVYAERYPLTQPLLLCLRVDERGEVDQFALEIARAALSRQGQEIVAAQGGTEEGYVPLNPALREEQAARMDSFLR